MSWVYTEPEIFEQEVVGLISIADTQELTLQTGERLLDGREPCRSDVADLLTSGDAEFEIQCDDVRLRLNLRNGEIVGGTGFAWILTDRVSSIAPFEEVPSATAARAKDARAGSRDTHGAKARCTSNEPTAPAAPATAQMARAARVVASRPAAHATSSAARTCPQCGAPTGATSARISRKTAGSTVDEPKPLTMPDDRGERPNTALEGRYRIERELGAGGMATVYLAHDVRHQRRVALKVLRADLSKSLGSHVEAEADTFLHTMEQFITKTKKSKTLFR